MQRTHNKGVWGIMDKLKDLVFCPHCGTAIKQYREVIEAAIRGLSKSLHHTDCQYQIEQISGKIEGLELALKLIKFE